ncbi:drug/metabolite transporter (DMT)-like permease [Catenulispora sp. GP43]|uniref:DMT family transporter n=1 Tax=Catenulispora sp. GP43 TaxID=3156263 RepID=UPI00351487D8
MFALIVLAASFALLTVLARYLNTGFTIAQQVYLRSLMAFLVAVVAFRRKIRWRAVVRRVGPREWGVIVLRAVLLYAIGTTIYSRAATMTSVGDVSFIAALPLVSALGLVSRRTRATGARTSWVLGSAVGAAILSGFGSSGGGAPAWHLTRLSEANLGDLMALVAMLAIAVSYFTRPWHRPVGPSRVPLNNQEITALLVGVGALSVAALSLLHREGLPHATDSWRLWLAVAAAGVLNVLNVFLINYAFERVDAVRAGNLLTLECVWGLAFGLIFFGQVPGVGELVGGTLIVACAVGLNTANRTRPPAPEPARAAPVEDVEDPEPPSENLVLELTPGNRR